MSIFISEYKLYYNFNKVSTCYDILATEFYSNKDSIFHNLKYCSQETNQYFGRLHFRWLNSFTRSKIPNKNIHVHAHKHKLMHNTHIYTNSNTVGHGKDGIQGKHIIYPTR